MQEYSTLALVLDIVPTGEADARVFLFTKTLGRVVARAKSLRKINSKLASHMQPGMISRVRLVEKNGFQLTDALSSFPKGGWSPSDGGFQNPSPPSGSLPLEKGEKGRRENIQILQLIKEYVPDYHPDEALWQLIVSGNLANRQFLKVMGFDPEHAICNNCERRYPLSFIIKDTIYLCRNCFRVIANNANKEVITRI